MGIRELREQIEPWILDLLYKKRLYFYAGVFAVVLCCVTLSVALFTLYTHQKRLKSDDVNVLQFTRIDELKLGSKHEHSFGGLHKILFSSSDTFVVRSASIAQETSRPQLVITQEPNEHFLVVYLGRDFEPTPRKYTFKAETRAEDQIVISFPSFEAAPEDWVVVIHPSTEISLLNSLKYTVELKTNPLAFIPWNEIILIAILSMAITFGLFKYIEQLKLTYQNAASQILKGNRESKKYIGTTNLIPLEDAKARMHEIQQVDEPAPHKKQELDLKRKKKEWQMPSASNL